MVSNGILSNANVWPTLDAKSVIVVLVPVFGERCRPLSLLPLLGQVLVALRLDPLPDGPLPQRLALVRQLSHLLRVYDLVSLVLHHSVLTSLSQYRVIHLLEHLGQFDFLSYSQG